MKKYLELAKATAGALYRLAWLVVVVIGLGYMVFSAFAGN